MLAICDVSPMQHLLFEAVVLSHEFLSFPELHTDQYFVSKIVT